MATIRDLNEFSDNAPAAGDELVISDVSDTNDPDKRFPAELVAWVAGNNAFTGTNTFAQLRSGVSGNINDDSYVQILSTGNPLHPDRGVILVQTGTLANEFALIGFRCVSGSTFAQVYLNGGQWTADTGLATGTRGPDGGLALYASQNGVQIENRRGGPRNIIYTVFW